MSFDKINYSVNYDMQSVKNSRPADNRVKSSALAHIVKNRHLPSDRVNFSKKCFVTGGTKNFIVNYNGLPLKNTEFNILINKDNDTTKSLHIPVFKTDNKGVMHILVTPEFTDGKKFDRQNSVYRPLKASDNRSFYLKDNTNNKGLLQQWKMTGNYIDLGIDRYFLRKLIDETQQGTASFDGTKNPVIKNWKNAVMSASHIKERYRKLNTCNERTTKGKGSTYAFGATLSLAGYGALATGFFAPVSPIFIYSGAAAMGIGLPTCILSTAVPCFRHKI